jgi:4-hydroxybenzoate polyprenyltransferase
MTPTLLPYLRLVRAPAVFSALGDPLAGALVAGGTLSPARAAKLSGAAGALYLAGMALNDYADREEDARERPERPIPSGAVSPRAAAAVGAGLLGLGVLLARRAGAGWTGAAVAGAVLAYDFAFKATPAGPVAMGACRALSLLMGAEAAGNPRGRRSAAGAALLLGGYVAGLTLLARGETPGGGNRSVLPGVLVAGGVLLWTMARGGGRSLPWVAAVGALAGPAAVRAARAPSPPSVGKAVGAMIGAIPALDGALAAARRPALAAAVALPLLALVRWGRSRIAIH